VIIWSHGGGPNPNGQNSYNEWGEALAGAGYAVIHLVHDEDSYDAHCGVLGMTANSWSSIAVPMIVQTGAADVTTGENAAGRLDSFNFFHCITKRRLLN